MKNANKPAHKEIREDGKTAAQTAKTKVAFSTTNTASAKYVRRSMRVYGSYVIGERAVGDVRDGQKPVQLRILYTMHQLGATSDKSHRKSAKITGQAMGDFHPHGSAAIYDTMVNMVHAANPLVEGHGNFGRRIGTLEEDPPAAERYTEARLTKFGEAMLEDLADVDYQKNYSGDMDEPLCLPTRVPLLLANGSQGIAVGMSSAIPPHNLGELIDACIATVKKPDISTKGLLKFVNGPDHGYGVLMSPPEDVMDLYKTGKGSLKYRCRYELKDDKGGDKLVVVTSPCPGWNPNRFKAAMTKLADDRLINSVRDESKKDLRILVSYKDVRILRERILPALNTTESYQFYAVRREGGDVLSSDTLALENLRTMLSKFVDFRRGIETRRTKRLLGVAKANLKRQRALLIGTLNVKTVAAVVDRKVNKTLDDMKADLVKTLNPKITDAKYKLDAESAGYILETAIWKLGRLNVPELKAKISKFVAEVKSLLADLKNIDKVVIRRLEEMKKFAGPRRMELRTAAAEATGGISSGYVVARANGQILKMGNTIPTDSKRVTYDHVVKVRDRALAVTSKGVVRSFHLAYATEEKFSGGIVGLAKDSDVAVVSVDESGRGVCVSPDVKRDEITPIKNQKGKIVSGTGVGKGESLIAVCKSGTAYVIPVSEIKITRPNVMTYQLAAANEKVVRVLRLPQNGVIVHGRKPVKVSKGSFAMNPEDALFVVTNRNYAVIDKEKSISDSTTVLAALSKGKCKHTVPV
jgi:DNA gyrase/topoisomerase IV subunit A